jgi:hypothetical protein
MNVKSFCRPLFAGTFVCLVASLPSMAQTSSFYEPELNSLILETSVAATGYNGPTPLPALVITLLQSGNAQLRSRIDGYDPIARTYVGTLFLAPASEPMPAPAADFTNGNLTILSQSTFRAEVIYHVPGASLSIGLAGRFLGPTTLGATAADVVPPGTPFMLSFSYPADAVGTVGDQNATFAEISFIIPGTLNLYSQTGSGSILVTPAPVAAPPAANSVTRHRSN